MQGREIHPAEGALVFCAYLTIALWWLWPLPPSALDHLLYSARAPLNDADLDLGVWSVAWVTHALFTEPFRVFDANSFYPAPLSLAYSEHYFGHVPAFAPTYLLTGNPILAVNGTILLMYGLSGLGLYLLARRFVSAPAAFLGGLLFTFYPTRLEHLEHYYMLATGYLPLAMFFTERWLDRARKRDAFGLSVTLGLQLLCSFYLAYGACLAYGLYVVLAVVRVRSALDRRRVLGLGIALAFASAPFLLSSIPYLLLRRWGLIPDYVRWADAVPGLNPSVARDHVHAHLLGRGVGVVGDLLVVVAVWPPWRGRIWPRVLALSILALGVLLSFGPEIAVGSSRIPSPYGLLQDWLPGFSAIRSSPRFLVVAQLGLALLVALGLQRIVGGRSRRTAWAAALAAGVLSYLTFPALPDLALHERPVGGTVPPAYRWLAEHGEGGPLLELPAGNLALSARRMYLSHTHWLPLLDGYSAYAPAASRYLKRLAFGLPGEPAVQRLTAAVDVAWILVHRNEMGSRAAAWRKPMPPGLEVAASFGDDLVVRVTRKEVSDARARLFDPEATLGGVTLAAVGPECPGSIRLARPIPPVVPAGSRMDLEFVLENHGDRAWPGLGFFPLHTVHLMACAALPDRDCQVLGVPIYADVPSGGEVPVATMLTAPPYPDDYELRVRLFQPADGFLDDCGVAPLVVPFRVASRPSDGPQGSYGRSCERCQWDGVTLRCTCRRRDGTWRDTKLSGCGAGYDNDDGHLVCSGG